MKGGFSPFCPPLTTPLNCLTHSIISSWETDQANCSSSFQMIIIQNPSLITSLAPSPSLPNFALAIWNPSSTQSLPCSSLIPHHVHLIQLHTKSIGYTKSYAHVRSASLMPSYMQISKYNIWIKRCLIIFHLTISTPHLFPKSFLQVLLTLSSNISAIFQHSKFSYGPIRYNNQSKKFSIYIKFVNHKVIV